MATLTENVARVTSALADIEQAIIDKGVTPSGKCETFADAIAQISGGGSDVKVASGTFVTQATLKFVECGFKPTRVMVLTNIIPSGGSTQGFLQLCQYWEGQNNAIVIQNLTNASSRNTNVYITPVENGFNFIGNTNVSSQFQGKTAYYIAVG